MSEKLRIAATAPVLENDFRFVLPTDWGAQSPRRFYSAAQKLDIGCCRVAGGHVQHLIGTVLTTTEPSSRRASLIYTRSPAPITDIIYIEGHENFRLRSHHYLPGSMLIPALDEKARL